jgi:hypothetical protein
MARDMNPRARWSGDEQDPWTRTSGEERETRSAAFARSLDSTRALSHVLAYPSAILGIATAVVRRFRTAALNPVSTSPPEDDDLLFLRVLPRNNRPAIRVSTTPSHPNQYQFGRSLLS